MKYNIYIDESCHLPYDKIPVMCIGYTKIPEASYQNIKEEIKKIKLRHKSPTEIKWSKVSMSRLSLYKELIDFYMNSEIEFRCVLIKNKDNLNNEKYNDSNHDTFYNKVVYFLLNNNYVNPFDAEYNVRLDIKNTRGKERLDELDKYLQLKYNNTSPFKYFQHIHSHENELLQLTDLLIGAITYKSRNEHRNENTSPIKTEIIQYLELKTGHPLHEGTIPWGKKFNIFDFTISSSK